MEDRILGGGTIKKKDGWMVSRYREIGDPHDTIKIKKVEKKPPCPNAGR